MFPVSLEVFNANLDFLTFKPGDKIELDEGISLSTVALNHPQGAVGYRVNFGEDQYATSPILSTKQEK